MLLEIVRKRSVNDSAYLKVPFNSDGRPLHPSQEKSMQKKHTSETEPSFVDSIFEVWKLRWLIVRSKSEMMANKALKKLKHQLEDFIFSRSSTCRSSRLEKLMHYATAAEERSCSCRNGICTVSRASTGIT